MTDQTTPGATYRVINADCLSLLRDLQDSSIDAIVCDPPYGLANTSPAQVAETITQWVAGNREYIPEGKGFMGKAWDAFVPPVAVWDECLRVLKPGGYVIAFAGSRTFDLMTLGIRLAGFDIRDSVAWLYGCHDDRTEILTRRGWVNGLDLTEDDDVAQWATDGTISLVRPTARQRYDYDGPLVRFRNADVDQLVTPNHRVYLQTSDRAQVNGERRATWSDWRVKQAADVNRWQRMRLPAAGVHDGPGIGGTDYAALLGWVWAEGGFDASGTGVRIYQSSTNQPFVDEIAALMDRLGAHRRYDYAREWKGNPYTSTTWFVSGELANRVRADLPGKAPTYDLLWRMTADEKRALWDAAMKGDGSKASRTFWQKDRGALEWAQALLASIDCRGKVADDPRGALHWTARPTVELQARHLADASEDYIGEVWCVTVPSGAFIVRRNGRVSVSGNSGFPKGQNIGKAIDKAAGVERKVIGSKLGLPGYHLSGHNSVTGALGQGIGSSTSETRLASSQITAPATTEGAQWEGWNTALKPAFEPAVVARKPFPGTVANNVLEHGTGAMNIDGCRIGNEVRVNPPAAATTNDSASIGSGWRDDAEATVATGRWPANVILDESQAAELDRQSGESTSRIGKPRGAAAGDGWGMTATGAEYSGSGGASRFFYVAKAPKKERPVVDGVAHPTVKPIALMEWLVRLVTPPGGTVLDPFAGSGTTMEAAINEGFSCIAVERDEAYIPLIEERVRRASERKHINPKES